MNGGITELTVIAEDALFEPSDTVKVQIKNEDNTNNPVVVDFKLSVTKK